MESVSRRAVLWTLFVLVHAFVAWLGFALPNEPMGDVYRVYEPWSTQALEGRGIVGIAEAWVYPQLALVPMVLAHAFAWIAGYTIGWALLVTLMDAVAFAVLVGRGRSTGRVVAAGFWLAFVLLVGPVGLYRLDGFTVPIVVLACLWLVGRPWAAALLLAAATWIKVWPAAVLAAAVSRCAGARRSSAAPSWSARSRSSRSSSREAARTRSASSPSRRRGDCKWRLRSRRRTSGEPSSASRGSPSTTRSTCSPSR
jgi:hypothetical protein